jgi:hypothetical protein
MGSLRAKNASEKFSHLGTFKVDSGIGLPMLHALESTGEIIVRTGICFYSHTPCFSLNSTSVGKKLKIVISPGRLPNSRKCKIIPTKYDGTLPAKRCF